MKNKIAELLRQLTARYDHRPGEPLRCSFCHKSQQQVAKLIAGPKVFICDECIDVCNHILHEDCVVVGRAELETESLVGEAKTNLEAAEVLVTAGKHRPAAQLAREAALALLHALLQRSHWYVDPGDVEEILRGAFLSDRELGAELEEGAERRLLERYFPQGVPVTREEAEEALAASRSLQELVERKLAEKEARLSSSVPEDSHLKEDES